MHRYRTHNIGELSDKNIGENIKIAGFLHNYRDHGGIIFLDIRDHYGLVQVAIPETNPELLSIAESIPKESSVSIEGEVIPRPDDMINEKLATGKIEIKASSIEVLNKTLKPLPFDMLTREDINEDIRLRYRYLDLRRENMHNNIILRSKIIASIRKRMTDLNFLELQTPILTASSPEGARDFVIPSRIHPGKFYALPQAPQQFKQLYMASGFDKYFQIAPCFRDEDPRSDRLAGDFYQLDMEMAYATQDDVFEVIENVLPAIFTEFTSFTVDEAPFRRIPFKEAMLKYGTDKPDLRNPLLINDATEIFNNEEFQAFKGKTVRVISVPDCAKEARSFFDNMINYAVSEGAGGLAWLKVEADNKMSGPIAKFVSDEGIKKLIEETNSSENAVMFFIADDNKKATKLAGIVRDELARRLDLIEKNAFRFCWIVDYPMYEKEEGKIDFSHNPFSMPQGGLNALLTKDPLDVYANQYDLVGNGLELLSGAVRNNEPETMVKAFEIAGYTEEDVKDKFAALYNAFHYGVPPHAGCAPGLDRIILLITEAASIRDVVAFPLNGKGQDMLMHAPNTISKKQLREVHIKIDE